MSPAHRPGGPAVARTEGWNNSARRTLTSRELFGSDQELLILHLGEEYRLRITSNKKLILTK